MYHPDSIVNLHKKILKDAGLPHIRFHDLRHTFATVALQNGVDVKTVSNMLGHYDAGFTLRTYTHATRQMQESAAEKMGNFMEQVLWGHAKSPEKREGPSSPVILFLRLGQNLRRYIAAQFLTRLVNAKNPANLTACGVSWSWQCDSNTRPADYEPDSGVKTKVKQAFSAFFQRLNHQVSTRFPSIVTRIFSGVGQSVGQREKGEDLMYFIFWAE